MAVIKCKMCGGDLNIMEGQSVCECEYCGTRQTVPMLDDEKKMNLFARANRLRFNSEFDKASGIYESIIADAPEEAEAYWGLVLCKYGIEYVDDPATGRKIPTCHRSSFDSVMLDSDFDLACEYADPIARKVYREEAKQIEEIRKGILEVSSREEPYDIFICYKETDENGNRTLDSVLAQDLYDALTDKGYRVFFARISLEDKLGQEYEPYIFAALNSAKIMLAVGTDYDYYNAVWVKNEWSRYLKLMVKDKDKHLIPCYKNLDAYDMPEEFVKLQAQDLGKVGATQDLLRGIEKLLPGEKTVVQQTAGNVDALLDRGFMALEDKNWNQADVFFEEVLNQNAKCARAYLGKLMAELKVSKQENLKDQAEPFDHRNHYERAFRFADEGLKKELTEYIAFINARNERIRLENIYNQARNTLERAGSEADFKGAAKLFRSISGYENADALAEECLAQAQTARQKRLEKEEQDRLRKENRERLRSEETEKRKKLRISVITFSVFSISVVVLAVLHMFLVPRRKLEKANVLLNAGSYTEALEILKELGNYKNAGELTEQAENGIQYEKAIVLQNSGNYEQARKIYESLGAYQESSQHLLECNKLLEERINAGNKEESNQEEEKKSHSDRETEHKIDIRKHLYAMKDRLFLLQDNGTVRIIGDKTGYEAVTEWKNVKSLCLLAGEIYGVHEDGSVSVAGKLPEDLQQQRSYVSDDSFELFDVTKLKDVAELHPGVDIMVVLRKDGTAYTTGNENMVPLWETKGWNHIRSISTGWRAVGLKEDGTVITSGADLPDSLDFSDWNNITKVFNLSNCIIGLKEDGTLVTKGRFATNDQQVQRDLQSWENIVDIVPFWTGAAGLKSDGTVVATGDVPIPGVSQMKDIIEIDSECNSLFGLKKDGNIVFYNYPGIKCRVNEPLLSQLEVCQ